MRLALMQPYLFPYIGYFQLLRAVDRFVVYDDVTYIKGGWINRNNILLAGKPFLFTVPVLNVSSFTAIRDTEISYKAPWAEKLLKTVQQAYRKAPYYTTVHPLVEGVLASGEKTIGALATRSIRTVADYLGLSTEIKPTSSSYGNNALSAQARVLDICRQEGAAEYINSIGGQALYSKDDFRERGINLYFLRSGATPYTQGTGNTPFVPNLSIIDVLMHNSTEETRALLDNYELV